MKLKISVFVAFAIFAQLDGMEKQLLPTSLDPTIVTMIREKISELNEEDIWRMIAAECSTKTDFSSLQQVSKQMLQITQDSLVQTRFYTKCLRPENINEKARIFRLLFRNRHNNIKNRINVEIEGLLIKDILNELHPSQCLQPNIDLFKKALQKKQSHLATFIMENNIDDLTKKMVKAIIENNDVVVLKAFLEGVASPLKPKTFYLPNYNQKDGKWTYNPQPFEITLPNSYTDLAKLVTPKILQMAKELREKTSELNND